jgi:uncharacterized protein (TIGR02246 family)
MVSQEVDIEIPIEERIRRLEAQQRIRDLVSRYSMAVDDRALDELAELFARDGAFRHLNGGTATRGRDAVREFYLERMKTMGPSYHYPHDHIVDVTGPATASGVVNAHAEMGIGGRCIVVALRYNDDYVLEEDEWRFRDRALQFRYFMDLADLDTDYSHSKRLRFPEPMPADLPESLPSYKEFQRLYM